MNDDRRERATTGFRITLAILIGALLTATSFSFWLTEIGRSIGRYGHIEWSFSAYKLYFILAFFGSLFSLLISFALLWSPFRYFGIDGPIAAGSLGAVCAGLWAWLRYENLIEFLFVDSEAIESSLKTSDYLFSGVLFCGTLGLVTGWVMWCIAYLGAKR